jgi:hypothetical protein
MTSRHIRPLALALLLIGLAIGVAWATGTTKVTNSTGKTVIVAEYYVGKSGQDAIRKQGPKTLKNGETWTFTRSAFDVNYSRQVLASPNSGLIPSKIPIKTMRGYNWTGSCAALTDTSKAIAQVTDESVDTIEFVQPLLAPADMGGTTVNSNLSSTIWRKSGCWVNQ